jgi:hypothetical protein
MNTLVETLEYIEMMVDKRASYDPNTTRQEIREELAIAILDSEAYRDSETYAKFLGSYLELMERENERET